MELNTKKFKETLSNTLNFVNDKATIPINSYLIFNTTLNRLIVSVRTLEGITASLMDVDELGKDETCQFMTDSAHELNKIMGTIRSATFDLVFDNNLLTITSGKKKYELGVIDYESQTNNDYTPTQVIDNVDFEELRDALTMVNRFSGNDDLRPIMNGVNINEDHFVATDANKLFHMSNNIFKDS